MYWPSTRPMRTPAIVFSNGISERASAADAPGDGQHVGVVFLIGREHEAMICVS